MKLPFANVKAKILGFANKHQVGITTGLEIAGLVGTVALACNEAIKAKQAIMEAEEKAAEVTGEYRPLSLKARALIYGKHFWPSILVGAATCTGIGYSNYKFGTKIQDQGLAIIAGERALKAAQTYQEAVEDRLTDKEVQKVNHDAAIKTAERSDLHVQGVIDTGHGHELFYEPIAGYWFYSSNQFVTRVAIDYANDISQRNGGYYNDFLEKLGLPDTGKIMTNVVFIRDSNSAWNIPTMKLEYGTCDENRHELTGEKYAVITWIGNKPQYVDTDVLYSIDD